MRVRLIRRDKDEYTVQIEQASRKGKKVTSGRRVKKEGLREETARLLNEVAPGPTEE